MEFNIRFLSNSSRMIMKQFYQNSLEIYGCNFSLSLFITIFFQSCDSSTDLCGFAIDSSGVVLIGIKARIL